MIALIKVISGEIANFVKINVCAIGLVNTNNIIRQPIALPINIIPRLTQSIGLVVAYPTLPVYKFNPNHNTKYNPIVKPTAPATPPKDKNIMAPIPIAEPAKIDLIKFNILFFHIYNFSLFQM